MFLFIGATVVGTLVAFTLLPMRALGSDSWKIAAALMGRHIGGGLYFKEFDFILPCLTSG